jgi:hypothetical protein
MRALAFAALLALASAQAPHRLRVDAHLLGLGATSESAAAPAAFIALPAPALPFGTPAALAVSWALPADAAAQSAARVVITRPTDALGARAPAVVYDSGLVAGAAQTLPVPRAALAPATAYDVAVQVQFGAADAPSLSNFSRAERFFTAAGPALWAPPNSEAVWAPTCGGANSSFARFAVAVPLALPAGADGVLSALFFATASPPIYDDSTKTTKLLGGFQLRVGGALVGIGPGRTACGPAPTHDDSVCALSQPVDGFDVSGAVARALAEAGAGAGAGAGAAAHLDIELRSYALEQPQYNISRGAQAVLVVRWSPEGVAPDLVFGTHAGAASSWLALAADALMNPGTNKDSGWYTQPQEDALLACLPPLGGGSNGGGGGNSSACNSAHTMCAWAAPIAAPLAFASGALPLLAKPSRALEVRDLVAPAAALQLGPGWWRLDTGGELQGGLNLQLSPAAAPASGVVAVVQFADELLANGSVMWQTRAGMRYRDTWAFPPTAAARPEQLSHAHHEFSEFRWAELILTDAATGAPLDIAPGDFNATFWVVRTYYDSNGAASVATSSPELDRVFAFAATTLKVTTLDLYADSNTRQRSIDCMADDVVAALNQYSTTTELALPRAMSAQLMAIGPAGYISGVGPRNASRPALSNLALTLTAISLSQCEI